MFFKVKTGLKLAISFEGLRLLLKDLNRQGRPAAALLLNPLDSRDLKREILALSKQHTPDAEKDDHELQVVGFIGGVPIISHKDVTRGNTRVILKSDVHDRNRDVVIA